VRMMSADNGVAAGPLHDGEGDAARDGVGRGQLLEHDHISMVQDHVPQNDLKTADAVEVLVQSADGVGRPRHLYELMKYTRWSMSHQCSHWGERRHERSGSSVIAVGSRPLQLQILQHKRQYQKFGETLRYGPVFDGHDGANDVRVEE